MTQYQNQIILLKVSHKTLLAMETKKTQILKNKPIYLGLSMSVLSKTVMYEF